MHFGTAYYPDYFPESDWSRDLDSMLRAGISRVRILEFAWSWYQPNPDTFCFEPLDRFLELCLARGLKVCLATSTATPPPWFFQKYPDCRLIDVSGRPCFAHRHMVCWQHPAALSEALNTIERLASRYGNHPAVWGWQIDNEPNYAEDASACYDFNPHAIAAGQAWLRARYGTLEALNSTWFNAFWSQAYNEWSQVWVTHKPQTNPGSLLDFLRHREHAIAEFVHTQAALLRRCTGGQRIGINIPETGVTFSTIIGQDYWAQAAGLDWVGTDLYTATADRAADLRALRYSCDLMRSAVESTAPEASFILSETQGGPHIRSWACGFAGYPWGPDFLTDCVHTYAQRGVRETWFFLWRPTPGGMEIGMNATTDLDGEDTGQTREIARLLREDLPALASCAEDYLRRPLALVHYSQDTHRFLAFFKQLDTAAKNQLGTHAWLDAQGYRVRYLNDSDLERPIPEAALLVLPETQLISDTAQANLLSWAAQYEKGRLLLGPHTALLDPRGQLRAPSQQPLWQALGLRPGRWHDMAVQAKAEGRAVGAYRSFSCIGQPVPVLAKLESPAADAVPALYQARGNIFVYTHRWASEFSSGDGAKALPVA